MGAMSTKELMRLMHKKIYEEKRDLFCSLGDGGRYTEKQKRFAFELIAEHGDGKDSKSAAQDCAAVVRAVRNICQALSIVGP